MLTSLNFAHAYGVYEWVKKAVEKHQQEQYFVSVFVRLLEVGESSGIQQIKHRFEQAVRHPAEHEQHYDEHRCAECFTTAQCLHSVTLSHTAYSQF